MYAFLLNRFGERIAYWLMVTWYVLLLIVVTLSFSVPAAEFRYGNI